MQVSWLAGLSQCFPAGTLLTAWIPGLWKETKTAQQPCAIRPIRMRQNIATHCCLTDEIAGVLNLNTLNSKSCKAAQIINRWASSCHLYAKDSLPLIHAWPGLLHSVHLASSTCPALLLGSCMILRV